MTPSPPSACSRPPQQWPTRLTSLLDQRLLELYGFLALTTGTDTTRENVHDAWAVWKEEIDPAHRSLIPFEELTPDVQALDQPYVDAIHRAAVTLTNGEGNGLEKLASTAPSLVGPM